MISFKFSPIKTKSFDKLASVYPYLISKEDAKVLMACMTLINTSDNKNLSKLLMSDYVKDINILSIDRIIMVDGDEGYNPNKNQYFYDTSSVNLLKLKASLNLMSNEREINFDRWANDECCFFRHFEKKAKDILKNYVILEFKIEGD